MPDPINQLSNFEPGVPVSPMPPSEVRRRGDRLRRRNTALVIGGALAAVLIIVVPVAVFAGGDDKHTVQPAGPPLTSDNLLTAQELPVRDRLTPWEEADADGKVLACAPDEASLAESESVRRDFAADIAGSPAGELPASVVRTQVLQFGSDAAAHQAYQEAQHLISECPGVKNVVKDDAQHEVRLEGGEGAWAMRSWVAPEYCGGDCDAAVFDRMGVAGFDDRVVLVSLAEVGGPLEPEGLDASMGALFEAAIIKAGGVVVGGSDTSRESSPPALKLDLGLPEADGTEVTQQGPGPRAPGVGEVSPCDSAVWPLTGEERLAVTTTGPEFADSRELVAFADADQAVAAMEAIRSAVPACPTEVNEADPTNSPEMAWEALPADTGYEDTVTFSQTYVDGMPGGSVWQFTRVGRAIIAVYVGGEYTAGRSVSMAAKGLTETTAAITPALCRYTEAGC